MSAESKESRITSALQIELDQHGYGFQYAVIKEIQRVFPNQYWFVEVAEFPVMAGNHATHIDFVLSSSDRSFFLVAECKRVNPAFSDWCFVKAPFLASGMSELNRPLITEKVTIRYGPSDPMDSPTEILAKGDYMDGSWMLKPDEVYDRGIPIKSKSAGDRNAQQGVDRDAIEKAVGQACRGVSGLINRSRLRPKQRDEKQKIDTWYMPVIFTTANLHTSSVDLSTSELATGKVNLEDGDAFQKRDYLYLQYPMSPGLKHDFVKHSEGSNLEQILIAEYLRTIAIVSASGIEKFLRDFQKAFKFWQTRRMSS